MWHLERLQDNQISALPSRILKVNPEALAGCSQMHSPDGLDTSLSQGYVSCGFWEQGGQAKGTFRGQGVG